MKLVITGFSNSGKTTVFNALTGLDLNVTSYPTLLSAGAEKHIGVVKVPDNRIDKLSSVYQPKKTSYATVEYVDYAGITSTASGGDASQNTAVFELIKDADAIVHVARAFENESVPHPPGCTDPLRDVRSFETELIFGDLEFVEKRLERMDLAAKKGKKQDQSSRPVLIKCKEALEKEISLRNVPFTDEEKKSLSAFQFLSSMPEIIVINIGEEELGSDRAEKLREDISGFFREKGVDNIPQVIPLCGKIEMEIAQLPADEAKAFLDDLGIDEPAMNRLCRVSYDSLGLMSFFTVGKDEVKAWTIKKGTSALKAAGKIHSDIERGFIRAEVTGYDDYISSDEDMVKAREKGLVRLEGKTYTVRDGDIINFKFNV